MRILILAIEYPVCSARYAADALARLGHEVRVDGPNTGADIWGMTVDERYIWQPTAPAKGWQPDLVLVMDAHLDGKVTAKWNALTAVYGVDSHVRDYSQYKADRFFLAHHGVCLRPWDAACEHLPCGYDPAAFTPGPVWAERQYDAAMIGVLYGARAEWLYALLEQTPAKIAYGTGAIYDQYAGVYQNARLSLVRSANGDVAQRVWETAAMGCLVVMDWCPDADALGLVDGDTCLMYTTPAEAVEKVRWALAHQDDAEQIALAGQQWAQPGTWDARLQRIVEWAEAQSAPEKREKEAAE